MATKKNVTKTGPIARADDAAGKRSSVVPTVATVAAGPLPAPAIAISGNGTASVAAGDMVTLDGVNVAVPVAAVVKRANTVWPVIDTACRVLLPLRGEGCAMLARTGTVSAPCRSLLPVNVAGGKAWLRIETDTDTVSAVEAEAGKAGALGAFLRRLLDSGLLGGR